MTSKNQMIGTTVYICSATLLWQKSLILYSNKPVLSLVCASLVRSRSNNLTIMEAGLTNKTLSSVDQGTMDVIPTQESIIPSPEWLVLLPENCIHQANSAEQRARLINSIHARWLRMLQICGNLVSVLSYCNALCTLFPIRHCKA